MWEFCFWQQFILEYKLSSTKEKQNFFHNSKGVSGEYRVSMEIKNFFDLELFIFLFIKEIGTNFIQFDAGCPKNQMIKDNILYSLVFNSEINFVCSFIQEKVWQFSI